MPYSSTLKKKKKTWPCYHRTSPSLSRSHCCAQCNRIHQRILIPPHLYHRCLASFALYTTSFLFLSRYCCDFLHGSLQHTKCSGRHIRTTTLLTSLSCTLGHHNGTRIRLTTLNPSNHTLERPPYHSTT